MFTYGLGEETFDEIKEKLHAKQALSSEKHTEHKKVLTRTEDWYITPHPKKWRQNYERRKSPHDTGYFAPKGVPYKPHGNLKALSAISLIEDTLSISVNRPLRYTRQMGKCHHSHKSHEEEDGASNNTIVIYDVVKRSKNLPPAPTAGLDLLSKELGSNTRTLTDIRAGNSLKDSVNREFHRKGVLKVIKAPKVIFRNGHPKVINKPCVYLPPMLPTASSKICLLDTPPKAMVNPGGDGEEEVASRIKKMTRPTDGKIDEEHETKALLKQNFYAKVKTIYAILCCLHNLKSKELRRYKPLSFSTIKHLSKRPFHLASSEMQQQYHMYTASLIAHHHLSIIQNQYHATIHKMPTTSLSLWEDILYLHEENIFLTGESHGLNNNMQKQRVLPAWKRKVVIDDQEEWRKDEAAKLSRCIESIQQFKSEMGHKVACALQEKEQLRDRTRTLYLEHLRIKPGKEKSLAEMRIKTFQKRWAERKKDLEKPEWFARLEEEVKSIFEEEGLEQQGNAALEGLKQFMYMGTESLVLVVEKLCLVVMSLPAHYLCIQQVIAAFQFVCEFLIKTSPKLIEHLRRIRKLPSEVIELHPPDYLFGKINNNVMLLG